MRLHHQLNVATIFHGTNVCSKKGIIASFARMVEYYIFIVVLVFMKVLFWIVFCSIRAQPKEKHWGVSAPRPRRINDRSAIIDFEVLPDGSKATQRPRHTSSSLPTDKPILTCILRSHILSES
ncbi:uncharacterized protein [Haliotis cracherodii]|uniref:uncharacterized protein n=1 Tax=Haliotis cracherodii TaxID=6455 RepID=UPI0039EA0C90